MNQFKKTFKYLFITCAVINLVSEYFYFKVGIYFSKPFLLTLLGLYFFVATEGNKGSFRKLLISGFIFSIGGDTLLMFVEGSPLKAEFFLFGLSSFLITHILYSAAFFKFPSKTKGFIKQKPLLILPFLLFFILNSIFLWPGIPTIMKIPVLLYSIAIMITGVAALNLKGNISSQAFKYIFIGTLLFMFSDSLIGINKFRGADFRIPLVRIWIMSTYLLGQYLIAKGGILTIKEMGKD